VRAHLAARGVEPDLGDAVVDELVDQGALDDERFARVFVQDKRTLEHWGAERITRGLLARGVDRELVEAALAQEESEGELEQALALLARRFPEPPRDRRDRDRALGVLLRKGYDSELALDALARFSRGGRERAAQ
jgi:regulatory protein